MTTTHEPASGADVLRLRCTICGNPPGCDCWVRCWCGWSYERDGRCENPQHSAIHPVLCHCAAPAKTRKECNATSGNKTPCRCACHSEANRELVASLG